MERRYKRGEMRNPLKFILFITNVSSPCSYFNFCIQDEEDVKAIARLFADMGDSYVELIATGNKFYYLVDGSLMF